MLPILYKITKTGAIQQYQIQTQGNIITVTQGQVNGAQQSYITTCQGKNIGRANETTPTQQAINEAQSKLDSKLKSGYTIDSSGTTSIELPMKVKIAQDQMNNIPEQIYITPKLNGVNGTFKFVNDELKLFSRGGSEYSMIDHLVEPITEILNSIGTTSIAGELYIHNEFLQNITGAVKKFKQHITPMLEFHVFDLPNLGGDYQTRSMFITSRINFNYSHQKVAAIPIELCTKAEIKAKHDFCKQLGYEGIVIHDPSELYEYNVRSSKCWKYKEAQDAEFKTISYTIDKNGHPVITLETTEGKPFKAKAKGTAEQKVALLGNLDNLLNTYATIEFEELSKDGIPLKPVFLNFRDCDINGNPLT